MSSYHLSPTYGKYWSNNKSPYTEKIKDITYKPYSPINNNNPKKTIYGTIYHPNHYKKNVSQKHKTLSKHGSSSSNSGNNSGNNSGHSDKNETNSNSITHSDSSSSNFNPLFTVNRTNPDKNNETKQKQHKQDKHKANMILANMPGINSNNNPNRENNPITFEMDLVNCNKAVYSLITTLVNFYPSHIKIAGPYFNPPTIVWTTRGCIRNDIEELLEFEEDHPSCHRIMVSRFPGMKLLCMKHEMANRLNFMRKLFPAHYDFYPATWNLNVSLSTLETAFDSNEKKAYIVKTGNGAQGTGIRIVHTMREALNAMKYFTRMGNQKNNIGVPIILQEYCDNPLLTSEGYKFDFRIYVVLQSLDPLNFYVCRDGLARVCTEKYQSVTNTNSNQQYMHFTNYSINKNNQKKRPNHRQIGKKYSNVATMGTPVTPVTPVTPHAAAPAPPTSHVGTMSNSSSISSLTSDKATNKFNFNNQMQGMQGMQDSEVNEFIQIKQTMDAIMEDIMARYPQFNPYKFWQQIDDIVLKTMCTFAMHLKSTYKKSFPLNNNKTSNQRSMNEHNFTSNYVNSSNSSNNRDKLSYNGYNVHSGHCDNSYCFHIIGFDILLDANLKPWLLEVNDSPSLAVSSQIDFDIKSSVIESVLQILGILPTQQQPTQQPTQQQPKSKSQAASQSHGKTNNENKEKNSNNKSNNKSNCDNNNNNNDSNDKNSQNLTDLIKNISSEMENLNINEIEKEESSSSISNDDSASSNSKFDVKNNENRMRYSKFSLSLPKYEWYRNPRRMIAEKRSGLLINCFRILEDPMLSRLFHAYSTRYGAMNPTKFMSFCHDFSITTYMKCSRSVLDLLFREYAAKVGNNQGEVTCEGFCHILLLFVQRKLKKENSNKATFVAWIELTDFLHRMRLSDPMLP